MPYTNPINEVHVSEPGLVVVVNVEAADDESTLTFRQLLAEPVGDTARVRTEQAAIERGETFRARKPSEWGWVPRRPVPVPHAEPSAGGVASATDEPCGQGVVKGQNGHRGLGGSGRGQGVISHGGVRPARAGARGTDEQPPAPALVPEKREDHRAHTACARPRRPFPPSRKSGILEPHPPPGPRRPARPGPPSRGLDKPV
ncbi:DUF6207 family protein [Streptomyces sp. NPDC047061]|uniref:DUF6207 family protein n=1 Tax=Streptomyces sp. NPDC047061 TaxID=3154605 RepID=UPI00340E2846